MSKNRKLLSILSAAVLCATMLPVNAIGAGEIYTENKTGSQDGYDFELWKDHGNTTMTLLGNGAFSCEWNNINNCLFRTGKKFDCTQTYQEIGNIYVDFDCDYHPEGNSYLCVYGWTRQPLVEYYIVEDWGNWRPPGATSVGQVTIDGGTYDLYKTIRENQPSIDGDTTFEQYWSVRVESDKHSSGTISVSDHFAAWEQQGWQVGKLYEVALNVEGYQSQGKATVTKNNLTITNDTRPTEPTEPPTEPADGFYFNSSFEDGADGWSGRGDAKVASSATACTGDKGLAVTGRTDNWHGASLALSSKTYQAGTAYSFSVMAMQNAAASDTFKLTLQYTGADGEEHYDNIAEAEAASGQWVQLANTSFTIPVGAKNLLLYVEADSKSNDFFIDDAAIAVEGTKITSGAPSSVSVKGDVDDNGKRELTDLIALQRYLLGEKVTVHPEKSDMNDDAAVDVIDLGLLKRELLKKNDPVVEPPKPTEPPAPTEPVKDEPVRREGYFYNTADVSWIDPSKPMVAFAFDDGPVSGGDSSSAGRIQTALSQNGAHATFFYWGNRIAGNESEIKRAHDLGFEIANHTWTHTDLRTLDANGIRSEIGQCAAKLTEITGETDFLLRPPYLGVNDTLKQNAGTALINCGFDSGDWNGATTQDMIGKFTAAANDGSLNGKVILMHETYTSTAEAVEYLAPYLKEQGWQIVSVSEMFKAKGVDLKNGEVYNQLP